MKEFVLWILTIYSADPEVIDREPAKAYAACSAAYATLEVVAPKPKPKPQPKPNDGCCGECGGTGFITHGDGHKTPCPCPEGCDCKPKQETAETKKVQEYIYIKRCVNGRCFIEKVPK
jgi:hypothetical protein